MLSKESTYVWLEKVCKLVASFRKSNSLIVVSADAVARIHPLNGLKDMELTWEKKSC